MFIRLFNVHQRIFESVAIQVFQVETTEIGLLINRNIVDITIT